MCIQTIQSPRFVKFNKNKIRGNERWKYEYETDNRCILYHVAVLVLPDLNSFSCYGGSDGTEPLNIMLPWGGKSPLIAARYIYYLLILAHISLFTSGRLN